NASYRIACVIYTEWVDAGGLTDISDNKNELPSAFNLSQNYPNPFNPSTKINYTVPSVTLRQAQSDIKVSLKVYDLLGNEIVTLVNEEKPAGEYEVEFKAFGLSSGIYFYKLQAGGYLETRKMVLLK
ncbi:MAG: T9SS type A sorting domain-containing protein, partial [Ignavibacteriaceae bacterium]|nr:T9SS type A sorting domain-containing protein [Ignavibacteriaceae bacterium]